MKHLYLMRCIDAVSHQASARARTSVAAAVLLTLCGGAHAAGADEERVGSLAEVLVTAQKREERLQDVPIPVSVINAGQLAESSQVLLRDYYASVPGLSLAPNYSSQQNVSIRGVTTGGLSSPTVGITVDDVPFQQYRVFDFDPGDLSRIEILRGPQGTLYGANSMGGLLKFVTKDPSMEGFSGRLAAGSSSVANGGSMGYNVRGSVNVPISDALAVRASAYKRTDPGYIDNPVFNLQDVNEAQAEGAQLTALWQPSEQTSLKLNALYQSLDTDGLHEVVVAPGLGELQQNYLPGAGQTDRTGRAYSAVLKTKLGSVDLTSVTGYSVEHNDNSLDFTFSMGQRVLAQYGVSGVQFIGHPVSSKFAQEFRLAGSAGSRIDWLAGVFYTDEKVSRYSTMDAQNPATGEFVGQYYYTNNPTKSDESAAFGDLTYHFTDRFDVQIGGRASHYRLAKLEALTTGPYVPAVLGRPSPYIAPRTDSEEDVFTYLLTPRFKVSKDLMLYARFASGFRPGEPNAAVPGLPRQSDSDSTLNYELGVKGEFFDEKLSVDASVYYIDWQDIQLTVIDSATRIVYATNGSGAKSEGVELAITSRPLTGLAVSAWASYDNAILTEPFPAGSPTFGASGDRLPLTPRMSSNLSLEQSFQLSANVVGFVGGQFAYVGERFGQLTGSSARQRFPSYTKTDLRLGITANTWTASVYVNNASNERGLLQGGVGYFYPPARIYITPRTLGLTVTKSF